MTRPGIEPPSPRPLANTPLTWPMSQLNVNSKQFFIKCEFSSKVKIPIIIITKLCRQHRLPWLSLFIHPYHWLLPAVPSNYIQCQHRADVNKFWHISVLGSIEKHHLWVHSYFCSVPHVLFILFGRFLRRKVNGNTTTLLWDITSRICSKHHIAFLCHSHLAFLHAFC